MLPGLPFLEVAHIIKSFIILAALRQSNTAPIEEMSQRWRVVGNTVFNLTGPRFEPQTSRSRYERVATRSTGRSTSCSYGIFNSGEIAKKYKIRLLRMQFSK